MAIAVFAEKTRITRLVLVGDGRPLRLVDHDYGTRCCASRYDEDEVVMATRDPDFVTVFEASDSFALTLAKSSLDDAGIAYVVCGEDPRYIAGIPGAYGVGEIPLGTGCTCSIQVAPESEAEARELLASLEDPSAVSEIDAGPDPQA